MQLYREELKECYTCKEIKPLDEFYPSKNKTFIVPFMRNCKECHKKTYIRGKKKKEDLDLYNQGLKRCTCCKEVLTLSNFYPIYTITNLLPFTRECIKCKSNIAKNSYQKVKEINQSRKERNRSK
jgi:hypothetical protein